MNDAATLVRKVWKTYITRKKFFEVIKGFKSHIPSIITMQRYVRGFLVRLRMWREAIRAEEELWAVVEIQRVWRGFVGRIHWESKFESVWKREVMAAKIQRLVRGWLARTRVTRMKRKIARSEFENARRRFLSSQKIQALFRGVLVRKVIRSWRERIIYSVVNIQRIARGHSLRRKLWDQVLGQRATMISSVVRGYLVRRRRLNLMAKVILIQRNWRLQLTMPKEVRKARFDEMQLRKKAAKVIQAKYQQHQEVQEVQRIQSEA